MICLLFIPPEKLELTSDVFMFKSTAAFCLVASSDVNYVANVSSPALIITVPS
jgi:hypothetical protein